MDSRVRFPPPPQVFCRKKVTTAHVLRVTPALTLRRQMDYFLSFPQPIHYYLLGGAALIAFGVLAAFPSGRVSRERVFESAFLLSVWAALFACRWPVLLWPEP